MQFAKPSVQSANPKIAKRPDNNRLCLSTRLKRAVTVLNPVASSLLPDDPASDPLTPRPGAVDRGDMMKDWTLLLPAAVVVAALAILIIVARDR
ncbi:hypothetical protein STVA_36800 [Allostella vacuolata]|nr:hypothetical protein STVA_36800 [Stella vacuolata]